MLLQNVAAHVHLRVTLLSDEMAFKEIACYKTVERVCIVDIMQMLIQCYSRSPVPCLSGFIVFVPNEKVIWDIFIFCSHKPFPHPD